jgi:hypothetical protein
VAAHQAVTAVFDDLGYILSLHDIFFTQPRSQSQSFRGS